jgi:UDP-N-acetylmuramoyl-L-alanyl-D-glutamate--2,6-diaminopimelate ligase
MGVVAARLSDLVLVTSDNPRSEDPRAIIEDTVAGIKTRYAGQEGNRASVRDVGQQTPFVTIVDRAAAISHAVGEARRGDVVIIAGKGHETYQVIAGETVPFNDAAVARAALTHRRSNSRVS